MAFTHRHQNFNRAIRVSDADPALTLTQAGTGRGQVINNITSGDYLALRFNGTNKITFKRDPAYDRNGITLYSEANHYAYID